MKIQSLSIMPPSKRCINNCKFCVSGMHESQYTNNFNENLPFYDLYMKDYTRRLEFARDNGCNTVMITGNCEPQQDRGFIKTFGMINNSLVSPFRNIEIQTTGVMLDDSYLRFLRNFAGISTISLSICSFSSDINAEITGMPKPHKVQIGWLCQAIKKYDFNLRLSINLTSEFSSQSAETIISNAKALCADQVTFRVLYVNNVNTEQGKWVAEHSISDISLANIHAYIKQFTPIGVLSHGAIKYSVDGMSIVIDSDCMSQELHGISERVEDYKYLILRENCKLYSRWDDPASLIF